MYLALSLMFIAFIAWLLLAPAFYKVGSLAKEKFKDVKENIKK